MAVSAGVSRSIGRHSSPLRVPRPASSEGHIPCIHHLASVCRGRIVAAVLEVVPLHSPAGSGSNRVTGSGVCIVPLVAAVGELVGDFDVLVDSAALRAADSVVPVPRILDRYSCLDCFLPHYLLSPPLFVASVLVPVSARRGYRSPSQIRPTGSDLGRLPPVPALVDSAVLRSFFQVY